MRSCAGVEVPVGGAGWSSGNVGGVEHSVERSVVEDVRRCATEMRRRHGLLGLERRPGAEDTGTRRPKRHGPRLEHALLGIVAHGALCGLFVGGAGVVVVEGCTAVAVAASAAPIRSVVVPVSTTVAGSRRVGGRGAILVARRCRVGGVVGGVGVQGLVGVGDGVVLGAELLKNKEGTSALEGMRRVFGSDYRLDVAVPWIETTEQVENLAWLRDGVADVAQLIHDALQLCAVVVHRHVALL